MDEKELLAKAFRIVIEADFPPDKNGKPYFLHLIRVAGWAGFDALDHDVAEVAMVGLLHDLVEDTQWTLKDLADEGFPSAVLEGVDAMTRRDGEGDEYYVRVRNNPLALLVKLADLSDNEDSRRLTHLVPEEQKRLAEKYRHARHVLVEGAS